jgi:hypothetical protein
VDNQHGQVVVGAVVGDVNGDGPDDIVVWNSNSRSFTILYGNGDGTFQDPVSVPFSGPGNVQTMVLAALNGRLDLVAGVRIPGGFDSVIKVFVNQGNDGGGHAQFLHTDEYLVTNTDIYVVGAGDFTGDHIPDVIFGDGNSHNVGVFVGQSDGTLQGPRPSFADFRGAYDSPLAIGDFDGDGNLDVAVPASQNRLAVAYGRGDGTFRPPSYYAMQDNPWAVGVGDFNGDGSPDLAVAIHDGHVGILLNAVGRAPAPSPVPGGPYRRATASLPDHSAADLGALGSAGGMGALSALLPVSPTSVEGSPAFGAGAIAPVDRFFAVLGQQASGVTVSRMRHRPVLWLDEVPLWEAQIEDSFAWESLPGGEKGLWWGSPKLSGGAP